MPFLRQRRTRVPAAVAAGLSLFTLLGCKDGPFYEMKKLNPVIQNQWKEDRARRPVYQQRIDEFVSLRQNIQSYPDVEQARYVQLLTDVCESETSPEIRRHIAMVLAEVPQREDAVRCLTSLSRDNNEKVRLVVAKSLRKCPSELAAQTLMAMAAADKDENVRNIAIESLGEHRTDEVRAFLAKQLDARQPGTQYSAYLALKEHTGKSFGGDASKMRAYLAGESVEEDAPSFWASPFEYIRR